MKKNSKAKMLAVISTFLSVVLFASCITVWKHKDKTKITLTEQDSKSEQLEISSATENQSSESSTQENEENNAEKTDESISSTVTNTESSTKTASAQSSASKAESITKATASKPKPAKAVKSNTTTEPEYYTVKYCENGQHQWDEWVIEDGQKHYRCCKNCEAEYYNDSWEWKPEYHMGNMSEYMELLNLVNNARKERGLEPFPYKAEWQAGADQRAVDLTQKFAHIRPDGRRLYTAYTDHGFDCFSAAECCARGYGNPTAVFNGWKNSEKHWAALMNETPQDVVISRCDSYWVFSFPL